MRDEGRPRIAPGALLFLLAAVPLLPNPGLFTDFDIGKRALLVYGTLLVLLLALGKALSSKEQAKVPVPENLSALSLLVLFGLFAAHRAPDRSLTVLALAEMGTLAAFGILAARWLADDRGVRRVVAVAIGAGVVAAILGLVGWPWGTASTFGNPSFAAEYVAGALPLAGALWLVGRRRAAAAGAALLVAFLVVARSRADWLGAVAGLAALLLLARPPRFLIRMPASALAAIVLAGAVALPWAIDALPLPLFGRSDTVAVRKHIRESTLEMALDHPVSGVGLGGFRAAYPEHRHPEEVTLSLDREVSFPHNLPLLVFAETGLPGLLALLLFLGSALFAGIRTALTRSGDAIAPGATGALVAILVSAQFSAPLLHPGSALLFFTLVGVLTARRPRRYVTRLKGRYRRAVPVILLLVAPVLGAVLLPARIAADRYRARAVERERESGGVLDEGVADLLARSVRAAPTPEALRQLALFETADHRPREALARLDRLFLISPHDELGRVERARALLYLGEPDRARPILEKLAEARPDDEVVKFMLAGALAKTGDEAAALPLVLDSFRDLPPDAARRYATTAAENFTPLVLAPLLRAAERWGKEDPELAVAIFEGLGRGEPDYYRAVVLAGADRLDEAMDALRAARAAGAADPERLKNDPRLEPLRTRADFYELIRGR